MTFWWFLWRFWSSLSCLAQRHTSTVVVRARSFLLCLIPVFTVVHLQVSSGDLAQCINSLSVCGWLVFFVLGSTLYTLPLLLSIAFTLPEFAALERECQRFSTSHTATQSSYLIFFISFTCKISCKGSWTPYTLDTSHLGVLAWYTVFTHWLNLYRKVSELAYQNRFEYLQVLAPISLAPWASQFSPVSEQIHFAVSVRKGKWPLGASYYLSYRIISGLVGFARLDSMVL